ncbi:AAEL008380-PA [Aedes aegypti]|uniref:AAEL008380-PA n=1 Tax=Aedes aegypti TaxID=7159 RepID=Q16YX5_AEDAE|nr:AAEL008380-PA [Aedes aegypti]
MKQFILLITLLGMTVQGQLRGGGGGGGDCSSGCPDFECHKDMRCFSTVASKDAVLLPHEDCNQFYKCQAGFMACRFNCPKGLHFNKEKMVCDWPWFACCDDRIPCIKRCEPGITCPDGTTTTMRPTTTPRPPPPPCSTGCPEFNCTKDIRCFSTIASKEAVLLPHTNCNKFYKCQSGFLACEFDCPKGLHFNDAKKVCDWPWLACCDKNGPCIEPCIPEVTCPPGKTTTTTRPTTTTPPTPAPCTTECPTNCHEDRRCSGVISKGEAILLPHLQCDKFWKCMDGSNRACEFECPPGLHFNREKNVCDWPWFACCDPRIECKKPCIPGITCAPSSFGGY